MNKAKNYKQSAHKINRQYTENTTSRYTENSSWKCKWCRTAACPTVCGLLQAAGHRPELPHKRPPYPNIHKPNEKQQKRSFAILHGRTQLATAVSWCLAFTEHSWPQRSADALLSQNTAGHSGQLMPCVHRTDPTLHMAGHKSDYKFIVHDFTCSRGNHGRTLWRQPTDSPQISDILKCAI